MNIQIVEKRIPRTNKWDVSTPAVGKCTCGALVVLQSSTNDCPDCPRAYNLVGNPIKNSSQQEAERFCHPNDEY